MISIIGFARSTAAQGQLIGTFTVNYAYNVGGCIGDPNPYYCTYVAPGPIHIPAAPGRYRAVRTQILNPSDDAGGVKVWDGDSSGGVQYNPASGPVEFDHQLGEITLYYHDWYPFDNNPSIGSVVEIYSLDGPKLTLTLDGCVSPCIIHPSDFTGFVPAPAIVPLLATVEGLGGQSRDISFKMEATDPTPPGHNHGNPSPPKGDINDLSTNPATATNVCTATPSAADSNIGSCRLWYVAPEIADHFVITASVIDAPNASDVQSLDVLVQDLAQLPAAGTGYNASRVIGDVGGATAAHPMNHFGTPFMVGSVIPGLAADYFAQRQGTLGINDMSLPKGGLFDLNQQWNNRGGHNLHRYGTSVDINGAQTNGAPVAIRTLEALARGNAYQLYRICEVPRAADGSCPGGPIHFEQ